MYRAYVGLLLAAGCAVPLGAITQIVPVNDNPGFSLTHQLIVRDDVQNDLHITLTQRNALKKVVNDGRKKYRDCVIRSLNAYKPYDRLVKEQIAGDELPDATGDAATCAAFGQDDKPLTKSGSRPQIGQRPILSGQQPISVRDSLQARPKTAAPVASANGRPGQLDGTPFSSTASISWRSTSPTAEFKLNGPGPFPKTGTFEVYEFAPAPVTGSTGLALTRTNQVQVKPITPIHRQTITTDAEGRFTVNFGTFAPRAPKRLFDAFGKAPGAAADGESSDGGRLAAAKIQALGYTPYYVRVVNDKGTSSTNTLIEYGEALPPETQSFAEVQPKPPVDGRSRQRATVPFFT